MDIPTFSLILSLAGVSLAATELAKRVNERATSRMLWTYATVSLVIAIGYAFS